MEMLAERDITSPFLLSNGHHMFLDGAIQVVIAMLITLAGLRVLAGLRPYQRQDENNLAEASIWATFLTLLVGLLIKSGVTEDEG